VRPTPTTPRRISRPVCADPAPASNLVPPQESNDGKNANKLSGHAPLQLPKMQRTKQIYEAPASTSDNAIRILYKKTDVFVAHADCVIR
jgi:hypothetical protein